MARLVIVSNRVPAPRPNKEEKAGGLAVALKDALTGRPALWFGWSGHISASTEPNVHVVGDTTFCTLDLTEREHRLYYAGFSNGMLWPLLHYRVGLTEFRREELEGYRAVNEKFANSLMPLLRPDDMIWVHDFHLIPLGAALRALGAKQRVGFFLHVPFPPAALFDALPQGQGLLADLKAYDLVGVQTESDAENLRNAMHDGAHVGAFPIGMDAAGFAADAVKSVRRKEALRLSASLSGRALILGVDRLDYSKGLPERFKGYAALLKRFPEHRNKVTFLQVAPISRGDVAQYRALKRELDELAGRINGEHGDIDWNPIRWITRGVPRAQLAGFHRLARVGLVTPLRDGMNLVAKEFIAAQNPHDPGVLVLSRFAGAAAELKGAILVNPHDPEEIAEGLHAALTMDTAEAKSRWAVDMETILANSAAHWSQRFIDALQASQAALVN
ncbi:trehalose 6-phosphate synthase [Humitalea rosea]|uniref:Trehalose 6-phosphate synthase n=1 Tax=Humitalea rosea TaxID=990373 RepID=A0A2W7IIB7_9PROT|nr:trehalose-6-phosphate synthase [Humitalea rosea]PZW44885.1 trehalose 6-phosphate synthase [Humitalea rosea]